MYHRTREGGVARVQIMRRMTRHRQPPAFGLPSLHLARAGRRVGRCMLTGPRHRDLPRAYHHTASHSPSVSSSAYASLVGGINYNNYYYCCCCCIGPKSGVEREKHDIRRRREERRGRKRKQLSTLTLIRTKSRGPFSLLVTNQFPARGT